MSKPSTDIPDVAAILAPLLARVPAVRQPLLLAIAERMAAERYRGWAADPSMAAHRTSLLECAAREERIASTVEVLTPDAARIEREILTANPDLREINRTVFADRPIATQMAIQAAGERAGAAAWQAFAAAAGPGAARAAFLACASLEEESAVVLDRVLGRRP